MDITAIASALADRFAADLITPPSGYTDPGTAVYQLPNAITSTPTAVVFPPEGEFSYAVHKRSGNLDFPVRFYIAPSADLPRATQEMYDWSGTLLDRLQGRYDLDLSPTVTHAVISELRFGKLEYADAEYVGVEFIARVHTEEPFAPSSVGGFNVGYDAGFDK
jgi:hypothetical protein